jgi:hypothetical protein
MENLFNRPEGIVIAVGTGEDDDAEFHEDLGFRRD